MINRSSEPSLLRSKGGKTANPRLKESGSLTHKTLLKEPSLRALGAKKKEIEYGLPQAYKPDRLKKSQDGVAKNARLVKSRKSPPPFEDPKEFGPNASKSARRGDHFKTGGRAKDDMWIQDAIKKPGALRKTLHVKAGQKIPLAKLEKAEHSKNPTTRRRATLAQTMRGFHH